MSPGRFDIILDQRAPLRGGGSLSATLYLPDSFRKSRTASPTLVTFTPYGADFAHTWASRNASWGYPVAVFDVLGRGESDGVMDQFGSDELAACLDALAWVRVQPWCNGEFGLYGGSYAGILQWRIAAAAPEGLRAIAPTVAPMPGFDEGQADGVPWLYWLRWAAYIHGRCTRHNLFADDGFWVTLLRDHWRAGESVAVLAKRFGVPLPSVDKLVSSFKTDRPMGEQISLAAIDCPVLTITGTADDAQRGALAWHHAFMASGAAHVEKSRLIVGPWDHSGRRAPAKGHDEPAALDPGLDEDPVRWSDELTLAWFDHHLLGKPAYSAFEHPATVFVQGAERWASGEGLLSLAPSNLVQFPDASGRLSLVPESPQSVSFECNPWDERLVQRETDGQAAALWRCMIGSSPEGASFADLLDADSQHAACGIAFWSAPLEAPVTLLGQPTLKLAYALDRSEADVAAAVLVQLPAGRRLTLSGAVRRLPASDPRTIAAVQIDSFGLIARVLPKGARIGLVLRSVVSISYQRCDHDGGDAMTAPIDPAAPSAVVTLHLGAPDRTTLSLPVGTQS